MDLFPFPEVRNKQDRLMENVEKVIQDGESLVAHAPTGLGKCVSGDSQVLTDEGIGRIDELKSSKRFSCNSFDQDLSSDMSEAMLIEKNEEELRAITTYTGREIKATKDHKLLRLKNGDVEWVEVENLEEGDYIASPLSVDIPDIEFSINLDNIDDKNVRVTVSPDLNQLLEELKDSLKMNDRELSDHLDIPRKNLSSMRSDRPVKARYVIDIVNESSRELDDFSIEKISRSNRNTIRIPDIDEDFCYFLGIMLGDGGIFGERETISMTTADEEVENFFKNMMRSFNSSVREVHGDKYGYKSSNKSVAWLLSELGLPKRKKEDLEIPDCVLTSNRNLAAFVSGLLDTDGSVDKQGKVEFSTKSRQLADQLLVVLPVFGIRPVRKEKEYEGKTYQRLFISNQSGLEKIKEHIGFRIGRKQDRLEDAVLKEYNPNKDVIPEIEGLIKAARKKSGVEYSRKTVRRRLESYETGARRPSRQGLREVIKVLDFKDNPETRNLRKLINSDVFWDKVSSIKEEDKEKVYDLNVPGNHNFSANNLVLHNTAASLTPALEYAKQNDKKVFFVTPRHSQHQIAIETVREMNERHDETVSSVDLIGKSHLCEAQPGLRGGEGPDCPRHEATFTDSHELTEQAKARVKEFQNRSLTAEQVKSECRDVCPYQILMHMAFNADIVIADYFHIFHPGVREIVFEKAGIDLEDVITIVDEAHNLPSRTRSLFSSSVSMPQLKKARTEAETFGYYQEEQYLEQLQLKIQRIARDKLGQTSHEEKLEKDTLKNSVDSFTDYEDFIVELENVAEEVEEEQERSYCAEVAEFLDRWNGEDKGFVRCIKRTMGSGSSREIRINYSCLDPQISTKEPLNKSHSSVLMSGTLTPQQMYIDLAGLDESKTDSVSFKSPFPEENELNLVIPTLTTKYEERDDSMRQKYAWYLERSFDAVDGNCGVFFPSYSMMYKVKELLEQRTDRKLFIEDRSMNKEEKQEVLDDFAARKDEKDSVLLGVAAGSFGEGVDYPGEVLKAVFVVGLPLQRPDLETKELINFYDELFGKGWDYGYSYPAMNRAIQAAGRCIRSKDDEGVVVYMDKRYAWSNYRKVFPPGKNMTTTRAPWKEIEEFFNN